MSKIIEMAREAAQGEPASGKLCCELFAKAWAPFFERFAALVACAERERCANACEEFRSGLDNRTEQAEGWAAAQCADAIRALKDGEE